MKARKRLFAGFLALAMLLCMNLTVFAEGEATPPVPVASTTKTLTKHYAVRENETSKIVAPDENLTFTVVKEDVSDSSIKDTDQMPDVTVTKTAYTDNVATLTVSLDQFDKVGIYTYKIIIPKIKADILSYLTFFYYISKI